MQSVHLTHTENYKYDGLCVASHISLNRWPSDKAKENCDTNVCACAYLCASQPETANSYTPVK